MARINSSKVNNVLVKEILQAKVEALFQLKDRLLARDREIMFQDKYEMEFFFQKKSPAYIKQWLNIWKLYFCQGVKLSVQHAIANLRPITQYFVRLTQTKSSICHYTLAQSYLELSHQETYY
eukprot:4561388-Ditylum_brightwellii.AAC.1